MESQIVHIPQSAAISVLGRGLLSFSYWVNICRILVTRQVFVEFQLLGRSFSYQLTRKVLVEVQLFGRYLQNFSYQVGFSSYVAICRVSVIVTRKVIVEIQLLGRYLQIFSYQVGNEEFYLPARYMQSFSYQVSTCRVLLIVTWQVLQSFSYQVDNYRVLEIVIRQVLVQFQYKQVDIQEFQLLVEYQILVEFLIVTCKVLLGTVKFLIDTCRVLGRFLQTFKQVLVDFQVGTCRLLGEFWIGISRLLDRTCIVPALTVF